MYIFSGDGVVHNIALKLWESGIVRELKLLKSCRVSDR